MKKHKLMKGCYFTGTTKELLILSSLLIKKNIDFKFSTNLENSIEVKKDIKIYKYKKGD